MIQAFFTKRQKARMRERRRKKLAAEKAVHPSNPNPSPKKKRKLQHDGEEPSQPAPENASTNSELRKKRIVTIPAEMTSKEAKKLRKEERRKAKRDGFDLALLEFVGSSNGEAEESVGEVVQKTNGRASSGPKKSFPRINDLLKDEAEQKAREKAEIERLKNEESVPLSVRQSYVAVDCEMVGVGTEGRQSALARVSVVDWNGDVLLDTFVQVLQRVSDFRTHVSGVTPKDIQKSSNAMEEAKCRSLVASLLKGKILVGHALQNDLSALMLLHPKEMIRDTAKYKPFQRWGGTKWRPKKLRDLVKEHLDKSIQVEGSAHDSVEDARATMELFKRVRASWEKDIEEKAKAKERKKRKR